jgi:hypothetical protein
MLREEERLRSNTVPDILLEERCLNQEQHTAPSPHRFQESRPRKNGAFKTELGNISNNAS